MKNKLRSPSSRRVEAGKIHIYTGNGKGKTTAALGLAIRARGAGLKVIILQFLKKRPYSELKSLKKLGIEVRQLGQRDFCQPKKVKQSDIKNAAKGLEIAKKVIASRKYDLVILDEINVCLKFKLIKLIGLIKLIKEKPKGVELVLTGRGAPKKLLKLADYVTEMKEVKHPFNCGLKARKGIEE